MGAQQSKSNNTKKIVTKIFEVLRAPAAMGILVTAIFLFLAHTFYSVQNQNQTERNRNPKWKITLFETVEWLDLKNMDARLRLRGEVPPPDSLALLTIDDRSVEQIGRWPWSREKIAFVIEEMMKYGAKSIGFDIIFSEPQIDKTAQTLTEIENSLGPLPALVRQAFEIERKKSQPDQLLAETLEKYQDRIVLGAFNETQSPSSQPYQDYCRNEAFKRTNADKFVKLNPSFIVDDTDDPYVDLPFHEAFDQIFPVLEKIHTQQILKQVFFKSSTSELNEFERAQLKHNLETKNMEYCDVWLTTEDQFQEPLKEVYKNIFANSDRLSSVPEDRQILEFKSSVKSLPISQYPKWTINTDLMQEKALYTGSFNAEQDADGSIRRTSMFYRTGNRIGLSFIPSLALQTYLAAKGYRAEVQISADPKNPSQKKIHSFLIKDPATDPETVIVEVPVDSHAKMKLNYSGGRNMYPYLPAKEIFNGKETAIIEQKIFSKNTGKYEYAIKEVKKAEFIKDRVFLFGATAIGIYDLRVTPFEKNYPGPETHLTALGNLMDRDFIKQLPNERTLMLWGLAAFGLLLSLAISFTTAIPGFLLSFSSLSLIAVIDQYLLSQSYVATMSLPAGLGACLYIFLFFYKYLTEEQKKKHLRSTFAKYVSPAVVDEILKDPENIELGGVKTRMSIFFSDVRGFTTISEKLEPTVLSDVLNLYLTPMTNLVFANKGTLDKYIGDAIMAFFGAPIPYPDHAKHACRCALANLEKLKEIQKDFKDKNLPNIDIGIGINTAEVSVGNMGSDIVRSYTVMGDGVNLAARLEGITKEYGVRIVISEFTQNDVKDSFTTRELDWVKVKGKHLPVRIYELICEGIPNAEKQKFLDQFASGFELFHQRNFHKALKSFEMCLSMDPDDQPSQLFIDRCHDFIKTPPPENWDGVVTMKTK